MDQPVADERKAKEANKETNNRVLKEQLHFQMFNLL